MISLTSSPSCCLRAFFIASKCGQGKPMGVPLEMQEVRKIAFAPRSTIIAARLTAFLPGQPPQLIKPIISAGPVSSKASLPSLATLKSTVPGHMSSVC